VQDKGLAALKLYAKAIIFLGVVLAAGFLLLSFLKAGSKCHLKLPFFVVSEPNGSIELSSIDGSVVCRELQSIERFSYFNMAYVGWNSSALVVLDTSGSMARYDFSIFYDEIKYCRHLGYGWIAVDLDRPADIPATVVFHREINPSELEDEFGVFDYVSDSFSEGKICVKRVSASHFEVCDPSFTALKASLAPVLDFHRDHCRALSTNGYLVGQLDEISNAKLVENASRLFGESQSFSITGEASNYEIINLESSDHIMLPNVDRFKLPIDFKLDVFPARERGLWGIMDVTSGDWVVHPKYSWIARPSKRDSFVAGLDDTLVQVGSDGVQSYLLDGPYILYRDVEIGYICVANSSLNSKIIVDRNSGEIIKSLD